MQPTHDVIVIGGGPGGYVAAIRCAQLGLRVACIDSRSGDDGRAALGGVCLNVGCIPSKALLDSSEQVERLAHLPEHGVSVGGVDIDIAKMMARKDSIVDKLTAGIAQLLQANAVEFIHARATLRADNCVDAVAADGATRALRGAHIILAPGSTPIELPGIAFDGETIVDSSGALCFAQPPQRLGVIGAGVIGLELGSVWRRLGAQVVLLEAQDDFLPAADSQIAREAMRQFSRQGLDIKLGATVDACEVRKARGKRVAHIAYRQNNQTHSLEVDRVIVAVGRRAATDGLLGDDCGVTLDARGAIEVDAHCRTRADAVWAIGDAVRGPMLAHKSSEEGAAVAERIAARNHRVGHVDFNCVPWVIYTAPEIAWVGQTETELAAQSIDVAVGAFPFAATGRALAMGETGGMVKLIADQKTDRLLGAHIIGAHASELIAECVLAMEYRASAEDLARTMHAHPTLSEAIHEAALAVDKRAIHKVNK